MIYSFQGEYRWLSNFWLCTIEFDGYRFPSVENAYQAAKCFEVEGRRAFTLMTTTEAKRAGRTLVLRSDWDEVKRAVMLQFLTQKFTRPDLREKLLATTGQELIEGNTWGDTYWGVCRGVGHNWLGKSLMVVRSNIAFALNQRGE